MEFTIDFNNGTSHNIEVINLNEAKNFAKSLMSNTSTDITILNDKGEELTESLWSEYEPTEDDFVLESFENGFYQMWTDEFRHLPIYYGPRMS